MKRRTIDAIHEVRMTIVQIVIPAGIAVFAIDCRYPDLKYKIRDKFKSKKETVKSKIVEFKGKKEDKNECN